MAHHSERLYVAYLLSGGLGCAGMLSLVWACCQKPWQRGCA